MTRSELSGKTGLYWSIGGAALVAVPGMSSTPRYTNPLLSGDRLSLIWADNDADKEKSFWVATRTGTDAPFGAAKAMKDIAVNAANIPGWLSPDGCVLYYSSIGTGGPLTVTRPAPAK